MSDVASHDLTSDPGNSTSADPTVVRGVSLSVAAQLIKALGQSQVPTQAQLLTSQNELLALQQEALATADKKVVLDDGADLSSQASDDFFNLVGRQNAALFERYSPSVQDVDALFGREAAQAYARLQVANNDRIAYVAAQYQQGKLASADARGVAQELQADIRNTESAIVDGESTIAPWASVLGTAADAVTVVGGVATAAYGLYEYAGGTPDTQGPTLQAGTAWNPAGDSRAPSQLANVPAQVISVATEAQLVAAINQVNASPGNYTINLTASIVLTGNLPAIAQPTGSVLINGEGNLLYGSNTYSGLVVDGTNATIRNLIVQDFFTNSGGSPSESEGSAVASVIAANLGIPSDTIPAGAQAYLANSGAGGQGSQSRGSGVQAINGANVVVDNVTFADDSAAGASGGAGPSSSVYADSSSSITTVGSSFSGNGASGSQGDGIAVSQSGNEAVTTVTVGRGQTTTLDGGAADQGGPGDTDTLVAQGGGTVVLSGTESFTGGVVVTAGTTVELADMAAADSGNITFDSQGHGTLRIDPDALLPTKDLAMHLSGMTAGDRVDLAGLSGTTQVTVGSPMASTAGNGEPVTVVTVSNGSQTESLHFVGLNPGATFSTASDGHGGTTLTMTHAMPTPTGLSEETSQAGVVTFHGSAQAGSTVTLYQMQLGTQTILQLGTATVGADGHFTLTPGTQPDAGAGRVSAVATDSFGNSSFLSKGVALPADAGGTAPAIAKGMVVPAAGSIVVRVGTEAQLIAAINQANANNGQTPLAIEFTNTITLSGTADLPVLEDKAGVQIVGNGYTLQGDGNTRGLMLFGAHATIDDLTISDMVAMGGGGGLGAAGGGGGGGLGGGLMMAGDSNVTIDNVNLVNDSAVGGAGGESGGTGGGYGGGGGMGGDGGSAMQGTSMEISGGGGGIGNQATGGGDDTTAGAGIVAGAPSDQGSGAPGGVDGGGGAGGYVTPGTLGTGEDSNGGGGGIDGLTSGDTSNGGDGSSAGWGGGGGGNYTFGGNGGFGGGGGGDSNQGGQGGFAGGGGGGAPARVDTGAPGGFAGGAGGDGTNNTADDGGGGGGALGGGMFVEQGSTVTVENSNVSDDSVTGGKGQSGGQDGRAYGSGIFIQGNQSMALKATAGNTSVISGVIADETGSHDQSGDQGAGTLIIEGKGTVVLDASNTYSGGTVIDNGHLELAAAGAAGSGTIAFEGARGTLTIDPAATQGLTNAITNFSKGDHVDLANFAARGATMQVVGTSTASAGAPETDISISNSSGQQEQLLFQGLASNASFVVGKDGPDGTSITLASSSDAAGAAASSPAAGHVSSLGGNDPQAELRIALERAPAPGVVPEADQKAGSAGAGREPTLPGGVVPLPGADDHHTIASAGHGSQADTSGSHHSR